MNIRVFLILFLIFILSLHVEGGYAVVCDYTVAKRLSSKDKAELQIKERNGQILFQLFMTRYSSELYDGKGSKLLYCPSSGAQIGGGSIQLWIDDDKTDIALNGRLVGTLNGIPLKNRPDVSFTPSNAIQQKGKCRIQKLAPIEFSDDFARVETDADDSQWTVLSGAFEVNMNRNPGSSQSAFQLWSSSPDGPGVALAKASCWFWRDVRIGASFQSAERNGTIGLLFNWLDKDNYHAFTVNSDGACEILRVRRGKPITIASANGSFSPGAWTRLDVVTTGGKILAAISGVNLIEVTDAQAICGRVGITLDHASQVYFDDVTVHSAQPEDCRPDRPAPFGPCEQQWSDFSGKHFLTDAHMASWAHPRSFWSTGADDMLWFRSRLFNDMALSWQRGPRFRWPGTLRIRLFSDEATPTSGYLLEIKQPAPKKPLFEATLSKEGTSCTTCKLDAKELTSLKAAADNGVITLEMNGLNLLEWKDSNPIASGMMGVDFGTANLGRSLHHPDWRDTALVMSSHRLDYSFENAPAAWYAQSGRWQGTHRWACVPRWSFYGGRGPKGVVECESARAALWNLRQIEGDFDLELFAAPMEGTPQRAHFSWPVSLNVAFCADGQNLGSGYTFSYGTYDIPSRLFWKNKELVANAERVDDTLRSRINDWYHKMTQVWQHIRVQRRNGKILIDAATHSGEGHYDGLKRIFETDDASNGQNGQFGIWTWENNGLSIARATLSYQNSNGAAKAKKPIQETEKIPGGTRHFCNPENGGLFQAVLSDDSIDVYQNPTFSFKWRPGPNTSLALFLSVRDQVLEVPLMPDTQPHDYALGGVTPQIKELGDGWQEVRFAPAEELIRAFPDGLKLNIDRIVIATPFHTLEEIGGIGINQPGAYFDVSELIVETGLPIAPSTTWYPRINGVYFVNHFEDSFGDCRRFGGHDGAALSLDGSKPASGSRSLKLLNQRVDGPAGATLVSTPFTIDAFPQLTFQLRHPVGLETHISIISADRHFDIDMTPNASSSWTVVGSQIPPSDNQWHAISIDLAALLTKYIGKDGRIDTLLIADSGNMSTRQRLAYHLDEFQLIPALTPTQAIELISSSAENPIVAYRWRLVDTKWSENFTDGASAVLNTLPDGKSTVELQPRFKNGSLGRPQRFTVVKTAEPHAVPPTDKPAPTELLAPTISYIPTDRLCRTTMERQPGCSDRLADMEDMCIRRECWLSPTTEDAATGEASAEITNLERHDFCSMYFRRKHWSPNRWPCISFDYCFKTPGCQLVLELLVNDVMTVVEWTGPNAPGNYFHSSVVGRTPWAVQDGKWHHVEFNFLEMLTEKRFGGKAPGDLSAAELCTWSTVHNGHGYDTPHGARFLIDNFTIYSPTDATPSFEWRMPVGSLPADGYSYVFDQAQTTIPPETVMTKETTTVFKDVKPGTWYLHLRAHSPDGKWSPAAHCKIITK